MGRFTDASIYIRNIEIPEAGQEATSEDERKESEMRKGG
jgi:hypothetical protein